MLLDAHHAAVAHVDDGGPAAEEVRAPALEGAFVGGIELDPREAHADDRAVGEPDRSVDDDVIVLGGPCGDDLENAVSADDDCLRFPGRHPLHVRIEHRLHRLEVPVDERVVAAQQKLGALVALVGHAFEFRWLHWASQGPIAQLGERRAGSAKVAGSSPAGSIAVGVEPEEWRTPSRQLLKLRRLEVGVPTALLVLGLLFVAGISQSLLASGVGAAALAAGAIAWIVVGRRFRSWGYAEREDDLLVRRGVMFARLSVVPYGRMQFIDVSAGPLERAFGLATVRLHTAAAATDARIPGLEREEAGRLRDRLTELGEAQAAGL